ncbi:hypothetical protein KGP36_01640 [Patescibacteria group bacterium]|nr:hypothetical protein [Patescibacteria group bacterium]
MSGSDILNLLRVLLRDTSRGMATTATFYEDDVLLRALNIAQQEVALALIQREPRADITVSRLLKADNAATAGFPGSAVQSDFWFLECGYFVDGEGRTQYVPAKSMEYGMRSQYTYQNYVFVQAGHYYGSGFTNILYWRLPTTIVPTITPMTDFADAFYHVVKTKAAIDLLAQDDHDALDRWNALNSDFEKAIATLK